MPLRTIVVPADSLRRYSADPSASILIGRSKHTRLAIARKVMNRAFGGAKAANSATSPVASPWLIWTHQQVVAHHRIPARYPRPPAARPHLPAARCICEHDEPLQLRRVACGTTYLSHAPPPGARLGDEQHENRMFACAIAWRKTSNTNDVETG
ncbi:hypothetical protein BD779DRAFT_1804871 [Infundibulicybe gibba]|nr:hypothetical protein BD779DRAFT_1804871 [Infundibulicybe gibba]